MMEGLARNPNLENKLRLYFFIGLAFAETAILYGLLIALILLFTGVLSGKAGF
jgi:F-type H+-transporting ATPase subunit c